jgi:hypothetical protein
MSRLLSTTDYEGNVYRGQSGKTEALKVIHKIVDGGGHVRRVPREGNGLEVVRVGPEVQGVVAEGKSGVKAPVNVPETAIERLDETGDERETQAD